MKPTYSTRECWKLLAVINDPKGLDTLAFVILDEKKRYSIKFLLQFSAKLSSKLKKLKHSGKF